MWRLRGEGRPGSHVCVECHVTSCTSPLALTNIRCWRVAGCTWSQWLWTLPLQLVHCSGPPVRCDPLHRPFKQHQGCHYTLSAYLYTCRLDRPPAGVALTSFLVCAAGQGTSTVAHSCAPLQAVLSVQDEASQTTDSDKFYVQFNSSSSDGRFNMQHPNVEVSTGSDPPLVMLLTPRTYALSLPLSLSLSLSLFICLPLVPFCVGTQLHAFSLPCAGK